MNMQSIEVASKIYELLCDEKSKEVFRAKFDFIINKDEVKLFDWSLNQNEKIDCPELDLYEITGGRYSYIIFGAGQEGMKSKRVLEATNRKIAAWCDNNRILWGTEIDGIKVISPGELVNHYRDATVLISIRRHILPVYQQLLMMGFPRENIFIPKNGFLLGFMGKQYFDMFEPKNEEIFVDAGCWDGATSKEFVSWCEGKYERIYAFEPDASCWLSCENTFQAEKIDHVQFIKKGTWKETTTFYFEGIGRGSSKVYASAVSPYRVSATSIDDVLDGEKVTFIKLDVEGSELETLIGAEKSIRKYKPRLAVSVYHKPEDLWVLAEYIISLDLDYKLYMRHYTTCNYETVLYAL